MNPKKKVKWICLVIVAALCAVAVFMTFSLKPVDKVTTKSIRQQQKAMIPYNDTIITGMPVTVRTVEPGSYPAVVTVSGEVVPRWQAAIKTQVDGRIVFLSDQLEVGNSVKRDDILIRIEKSALHQQMAEVKNRLSAAKVTLLKEEREAWEARKNWKQSGIKGEPSSLLVLREPQLAGARSEVEAAQASLMHAKTMLGYTEIRAPFDGVVIKRRVNPGETLFAGDEVVTLFGMETAEVSVHLDAGRWALLAESIRDTKVTLFDTGQEASWQAEVIRSSHHLNRDSRLRTLFLQVKHPIAQTPPLLPGTFVRAEMLGRNIPDLLRIPESALTKQGLVWFVDSKNRLSAFRLEPVFYGKGVAFIQMPMAVKKPMRVAVSPNSSFINGLVVQPLPENGSLK